MINWVLHTSIENFILGVFIAPMMLFGFISIGIQLHSLSKTNWRRVK